MDLEHKSKKTFSIQHMPNGRPPIYCIFMDAEVVELLLDNGARLIEVETKIVPGGILLEIVGDEEHPTTGRRWCDCVEGSVEYVIQNWWLLMFILDRLCGK